MARVAVLASGNGSNFEALVLALRARDEERAAGDPGARAARGATPHECALLVHDRREAFAAGRARRLGVPALHVGYAGRSREEAESAIQAALAESRIDAVALAGFMRLLSPAFVGRWRGRILNVHPALLPAWPGVDSIHRSFAAGERRFGATVHLVDEGMDTGPILAQEGFDAAPGESLESIEERVHALEYRLYPRVLIELLDRIDREAARAAEVEA